MKLTNRGTPMDEDGHGDMLTDIDSLFLMMGGKSNDMNAASKGVDQSVSEIGFPLIANNLSEYAGNPAAIQQIRTTLGVPAGITGLSSFGGMPVGGTILATSLYTSGSGTHTFNVATTYALFRLIGAGGQGGGTPGAADMYGGGGGQGATVWGCMRVSGFANLAYAIGAGGTGGTSTSVGGDGAASTIIANSVTITANPGLGGAVGGTSFSSDVYSLGGTAGSVEFAVGSFYSTWGTSGAMGQPGGYAHRGKGGQTSPVTFGNGSTGGAQGNAAGTGTDGHLVIYEI